MINEYIDIVEIVFIGFPSNLSPHTFIKFLNIKLERRRPVIRNWLKAVWDVKQGAWGIVQSEGNRQNRRDLFYE